MPINAPPAAKPSKSIFDPFNSSATGHQRADNRLSGSTSWRDSRSSKLREQFNAGAGGGKRVSDTVGAGSLDFGQDGRTENGGWMKGASGLRTGGQKSIWESMGGVQKEAAEERPAKKVKLEEEDMRPTNVVNPWTPFRREDGAIRESSWTSHESSPSRLLLSPIAPFDIDPETTSEVTTEHHTIPPTPPAKPSQIFKNLTFYINGSTAPTISDHKLKHLISTHGGSLSIALGRRTVTHVILGRPNSAGGCGGGLAGSKIQKEVARKGGCAVKFVTVEWVVESVKAGKRLSEARFEGVSIAPRGVRSLVGLFGTKGYDGEAGKR
ncbi:BRCT domain, a BRCA1 C-terminus domain [Teratosphaeria destructans]|uniref:BRCT domain, a BRCA1 C-terminus domain n=1 Tax=Teratosphaeria destructans TaxID=418781 RepID=A0A9W7VZF4_9PEZI|nr:BRCT domain, a BRCA1 C-terminus domain [Teratosphaeria destructans]